MLHFRPTKTLEKRNMFSYTPLAYDDVSDDSRRAVVAVQNKSAYCEWQDLQQKENDSHLKSSEEALTHLEEVISHVISEAVEYADKPPEERTLPALVRKSATQPRRPNAMGSYGQINACNNGTQIMGFGQMGAYGFPQVQRQMQCNPRFTVQNTALLQQSPQRIMAQYNGIQAGHYHAQNAQLHQQYTQAAQHFQLQQQQAQYQIQLQQQAAAAAAAQHQATAIAVAQQQQAAAAQQHQQMMYASGASFSVVPTATASSAPTAVTPTTPQAAPPPSTVSPTVSQQQHSLNPQQLHQLSAAYAAAHQLPGMIQAFTPAQQVQAQSQQMTAVTAQQQQQQRWTASSPAGVYQQQQQPNNPSDAQQQQQQQQQFLHAQQVQAQVQHSINISKPRCSSSCNPSSNKMSLITTLLGDLLTAPFTSTVSEPTQLYDSLSVCGVLSAFIMHTPLHFKIHYYPILCVQEPQPTQSCTAGLSIHPSQLRVH
ncbi:Nuclear receptor coactivator 2 [Echinococcus granulosus]|uniref:Nuclear receptor coactivator 2 n=1 Tax=Echinococcus granulosus TaxID=6210 RepID=W6UPM6_ECHGR|nr:Nuclear receptor coactivator 2 [Echinococcus granulosus]EUB63580.1 Nuclear receptor coactivator 2 [Echinococcus granulosus]